MYIIRLDDACSFYDSEKWQRIEAVLNKFSVKPIVAVIPNCEDPLMLDKYVKDESFWDKARNWQEKGWTIALHGYNHVYINHNAKGINPVNDYSEFAGVALNEQIEKIRKGLEIFKKQGLTTNIFVAPAHSFDLNTLKALKKESDIRIISDTIASDIYFKYGFYFIPQQCGALRKLPFKVVTGCYHPNSMNNKDFEVLEAFLNAHFNKFVSIDELSFAPRRFSLYDFFLKMLYFTFRKIRKILGE